MNCREFENIVHDLSREHLMDAALRASGLDHTRDCDRCATRLTDERTLSAGLRALAAEDDDACPSIESETRLLTAYRQSIATTHLRTVRRSRWVFAAAAVIMVALGFIVYRALQAKSTGPELVGGKRSVFSTPTPATAAAEIRRQESQGEGPVIRKNAVENPNSGFVVKRSDDKPRRGGSNNRADTSGSKQILIRDGMTLYANTGDGEVTSDFLPLTYSSNLSPVERGQLIRVQMPRSALLKFGLPMNVEQANVPVKADLLVGEDGLALAIRFVR